MDSENVIVEFTKPTVIACANRTVGERLEVTPAMAAELAKQELAVPVTVEAAPESKPKGKK